MIERIVGVEKLYRRRKEKIEVDKIKWGRRRYWERKEKGICVNCEKELKDLEKKKGFSKCYRCRYKLRKKR